MMLQACLGVKIDGAARRVEITDPRLPIGIDRLRVEDLRVGPHRISLVFEDVDGKIVVRWPPVDGVRVVVR